MVANVDRLLMAACEKGDLDAVIAALDAGADLNATPLSNLAHMQGTPLMRAARHGYVDIARVLLQRGADIARQERWLGTALHCAASQGHVAMARLLVERGANLDALDEFGRTAIHKAVGNQKYEVVRFLVDVGADVNASSDRDTPLDIASLYKNTLIADFLKERGAERSRAPTIDRTIDTSLLTQQLSAQVAESKYGDMDQWKQFVSNYQDGDEFWEFSSSEEDWQMLMGSAGIFLVRGDTWVDAIVTMLN